MKRIGLLSDTHSYWDERFLKYFDGCDEIWHAGDIGDMDVMHRLSLVAPIVRGVYGNIDSGDVRYTYPEILQFTCEGVSVVMKHIGGYPGRYNTVVKRLLFDTRPTLFISGHSHLLKVMFDHSLQCLHINPGAAGVTGFHKVRTLVRFVIDGTEIKDLEVIELNG